jgi:iron complex outermembrane receptor protein
LRNEVGDPGPVSIKKTYYLRTIMYAKKHLLSDIGIACLALFSASPILAQDAGKQAGTSGSSSGGVIQEVIVTAQKRAQNAQDVPAAITAFTSEMLEAKGISNPQDLQLTVPSLSIGEQSNLGGAAKVTLRGVGSENYGPGGDPGVPLHINGHYTQSTAYIFRDMIDIDRVEVQRGPQGTLYGRNAIGGNINLITRRPTKDFEGYVGFELGNYNRRLVQGVVSGPLSKTVRGRLVAVQASRDGFVEELGVGKDRDNVDYQSLRGSLEIDLAPNLQTYINAYHFNDKGDTYSRRLDRDPNNIANQFPFKVRSNTPNEGLNKSDGLSVDFTLGLDGVELRSLSAYDSTRTRTRYDVDGNAVRLAEFSVAIGMKVFTQEFQALSKGTGPLKWVAGAFYYKEDSNETRTNVIDRFDTDNNGLTGLQNDVTQPTVLQYSKTKNHADSWAVYGQADYDLSSKFQLVAGLRYTKDRKSYFSGADTVLSDGGARSIPTGGGRFTAFPILNQVFFDNLAGTSWSQVTGKLGLNYRLEKDALLYASYSRGYKAGGYAAKQGDFYNPETVDAYEGGLKGRWAEKSIQTNLAFFYYNYNDKQELQFFPPSVQFPNGGVQLINATNAKSYGAELEVQAFLTKQLRVDGSYSYTSATYGNFIVKDAQFPGLGFQDLAGHKLPLSPKNKFNIGAQYDMVLGNSLGSISARADYSWTADQWGNALNRDGTLLPGTGDKIPAHSLVNARVQWKNNDGSLQVSTFVRNLTNKYAISNSFVTGLNEVIQANIKPRTFGIKAEYFF